jgi:hypothetical protein
MEDLIGTVGQRLLLPPLTLERRSYYERELRRTERDLVVWRYQFRTDCGKLVVYSGVWLHRVELGDRIQIRATIKRHEPRYKCTRIARPVIVPWDTEQSDLPGL